MQDTPDFLRHLQEINQEGKLPKNTLVVTWDVVGLFTNIPHTEGMESEREARQEARLKREQQDLSTDFILRILEVIFRK